MSIFNDEAFHYSDQGITSGAALIASDELSIVSPTTGQKVFQASLTNNSITTTLGMLTVPNVLITNTLQVNGSIVSDLKITDTFIELNHNNTADATDSGVMVKYHNGVDKWAGWFRDSDTGQFGFVKDITTAPIGNLNLNMTSLADLNVGNMLATQTLGIFRGGDNCVFNIDPTGHTATITLLSNGNAYTLTLPNKSGVLTTNDQIVDISTLDATVATLNTSVSTLNTSVSTLNTSVSTLNGRVNQDVRSTASPTFNTPILAGLTIQNTIVNSGLNSSLFTYLPFTDGANYIRGNTTMEKGTITMNGAININTSGTATTTIGNTSCVTDVFIRTGNGRYILIGDSGTSSVEIGNASTYNVQVQGATINLGNDTVGGNVYIRAPNPSGVFINSNSGLNCGNTLIGHETNPRNVDVRSAGAVQLNAFGTGVTIIGSSTGGNIALITSNTSSVNIGTASNGVVDIQAATLNLDTTGTGATNIGSSTGGNIALVTSNTSSVNIGTAGNGTVNIQANTVNLDTIGTGAVNIATSTTSGIVNIGNTAAANWVALWGGNTLQLNNGTGAGNVQIGKSDMAGFVAINSGTQGVFFTSTTDATYPNVAPVMFQGGIGIAKSCYVGTNLSVGGSIKQGSNTFTLPSTSGTLALAGGTVDTWVNPYVAYVDGDTDTIISVNTTLSADLYCKNLTVNTGVSLYTNGWVVYCQGVITLTGTAIIHCNGGSGTASGGVKAGQSGSSLGQGAAGGAFGSHANGVAGDNSTNTTLNNVSNYLGSVGSNGNIDTGGTYWGGMAGTVTMSSYAVPKSFRLPLYFLGLMDANNVKYTAGSGGGGAGDHWNGSTWFSATNPGQGGGGAGGGYMMLICKQIVGTGSLQANGGNGTGANTVFGGGGGGGLIYVITHSFDTGLSVSVVGGSGWSSGKPGMFYKIIV